MIQIKSYLDEKAFTALARKSIINLVYIMAALAVLIGGTGLILIIAGFDVTVSISITVAGVIVPAFLLLIIYFYIPAQIKKSSSAKQNIVQVFTFDDKITLSEKSDVCDAKNIEYSWQAFYKAVEVAEYIFLYVNKYTAFIIQKNGFEKGTLAELRSEFKLHFGKRFSCPKN